MNSFEAYLLIKLDRLDQLKKYISKHQIEPSKTNVFNYKYYFKKSVRICLGKLIKFTYRNHDKELELLTIMKYIWHEITNSINVTYIPNLI